MGPNTLRCIEILESARQAGLESDLKGQVLKDFQRAGLNVPRALGTGSDTQWALELRESLYRILMERTSSYLNLMYAAGVPEKAFKGIPLTDPVEVADAAAYLLLSREWEKVCLRKGYKKGPGE